MDTAQWYDKFRFIQRLGGGGMGHVYLAEDRTRNNELCVIKQLIREKKDLAVQAEEIRMFQREIALLMHLSHPGIVRFIEDHASEDGRFFIVMEYVPGDNLETLVAKYGYFSSEIVVRLGIQCCEVLEYLHGRSEPIIYRDLKPSNLMLRPDGRLVLIDFGIARDFQGQAAATRVITSGYSPPEQYFGKPEMRSDLYSLGATMHQLLTGQRPRPMSQCDPCSLNAEVLPSLGRLVFDLTYQDLNLRPGSATETKFRLFAVYQELHPDFVIPARVDLREPEADVSFADDRTVPTWLQNLKTLGSLMRSWLEQAAGMIRKLLDLWLEK